MSTLQLQWIPASMIWIMTLLVGLISTKLTLKYRRPLAWANALANGIFSGTALLYWLPEAARALEPHHGMLTALSISVTTVLLLWMVDKLTHCGLRHTAVFSRQCIRILLALVTGYALGLADQPTLSLLLLIAILGHKGFETFAFIFSLHRHVRQSICWIAMLMFALVTPMGVIVGQIHHAHILRQGAGTHGLVDAITVGILLFIGTRTDQPRPLLSEDSHQLYTRYLFSLAGFVITALIALCC